MMEHVLEDVVVPDGHSHNMISSCHSLLSSQSESYLELSRSNYSTDMPPICELFPPLSLVDQVIDVDNLVTRLLKVIRIIQLENDDCMNEMQEQRDRLSEQVDKQKESNKVVAKQLKDWEVLGSRLKTEVKELMQQLSKKNHEIDNIKAELSREREEVEVTKYCVLFLYYILSLQKLNQDVCEISTALSKAEVEIKTREEATNDLPPAEVLEQLSAAQNEVSDHHSVTCSTKKSSLSRAISHLA